LKCDEELLTKYRFNPLIRLCFLIVFFLLCGCAHYPLNQPLDASSKADRYDFRRLDNVEPGDGTFVVLTFSGGGTRAAALAYGVLSKLRDTPLPQSKAKLLDKVNIISTVSGGSFTGAYYALFEDRIFDDFKERFLYRNIQKEIAHELFKPANWVRMLSPYFSRVDIAAELYDQTIFESKTFGDLAGKTKPPFLIINSTNMSRGMQFEFTSSQFDYIGSDILPWRVAHAVAASAAFPFLLSPISLKNYANAGTFRISDDDRATITDYPGNKRRYYAAKNNLVYLNQREHPYIHLLDGGIADNLGLKAIYNLFERKEMQKKIESKKIRRLLVIIVNAKAEIPYDIDKNESPPGLLMVGFKALTIPVNNYTFDAVELFRSFLQGRIKKQENVDACQKMLDAHCGDGFKIPEPAGGRMKLYIAELSFDNLPDQSEKDYFNDLPTSFVLEKDQVDKLIEIGGRLLADNPAFRQFLSEYSPE
jgi:NTE family protein